LEAAIEKIIKSVCKDDPVTLRGFGTFRPVLRKKKLARDISRKTTVEIPERYVVKFVPSDDFSEQLNYYKSKKK
jgi:DNA-binding protein HU-beta